MKHLQLCIVLLIGILGFSNSAIAGRMGTVFIKNNHTRSVGIWINGYYQGYVPSGKTCYTVYEGFVTNDSGYQSDGTLSLKHSHAGWAPSADGNIVITAMAYHDEKDQFYWQGTFQDKGDGSSEFLGTGEGSFWIGGQSDITGLDKEFSFQIPKGGTGGKLTLKKTQGLSPAGADAPAKPGGYSIGAQTGKLPVLQALGSGDVAVALQWTGARDVDLYVTDPFGTTISYQNKTSASGGQLDRDDTDGFGPENIFWPSGKAPKGRYSVQVQLYSGYSANYNFSIVVNGKKQTYNGTLRGEKSWSGPIRFEVK